MDVEIVVRLEAGNLQNLISKQPRHRGDLIDWCVLPGKGWGRKVCPPMFGFIRIYGIERYQIADRCMRHQRAINLTTGKEVRARSTHWINLDQLTDAQHATLLSGRPLVLTAREFMDKAINRLQALVTA